MDWKVVLLNVLFFTFESQALVCDSPSYLYKLEGDVMISGIIGAHSGEDCSVPESNGLQLIQALITSVEAANSNNLMPGLTLGLSIYDSCSKSEMAQRAIISTLVDLECNHDFLLSIIVEEGVEMQIRNLTTNLLVPTFTITRTVQDSILASMVARTLFDLHFTTIDKFYSNSEGLSAEFIKAASSLRMCIKHKYHISELKNNIEPSDTVVIMTDSSEIGENIGGSEKLLYVPLDHHYQKHNGTTYSKAKILLMASLDTPSLLNPLNISEKSQDNRILLKTRANTNLLQVQAAGSIMKLVGGLKRHIKYYCPVGMNWSICSNLPKFPYQNMSSESISNPQSIFGLLKFLRVNLEDFEAAVLLEESPEMKKVGAVKLSQYDFMLISEVNVSDEIKLCKPKPTNISTGNDCSGCLNFNFIYEDYLEQGLGIFENIELKQDAWVAALLSISAVGVLCCIAIAIFIVVRICKKDMLEGNPGFSFLLLLSILFMYVSILPFSSNLVEENQYFEGIFCGLKVFFTSLSYSFLFSVMLARSFMLASCDEDGGFMSHVNGYLQTVLFFFILAVQVALSIQFWAINWLLLSHQQCIAASKGTLFIYLLGYDIFLLILLLSISPFIVRSKRNYHEGSYFVVSIYLCTVVWVAWVTGYLFLPKWEEVFVCFGLVGTATTILVIVFIPRTYLMLTGIVRDNIVSTLPSLNHTRATSIVDMNYRSTQALYDSVTLPRNLNPNYYEERPTTPSTSKMEDARIDSTYERYDRSPSPRNITRF